MMHEELEMHLPTVEQIKKHRLQLLVAIVQRCQVKKASALLRARHMHLQYSCLAEGTASSDILDLLGLGAVDKAVILCLAPNAYMPSLLEMLNKELSLVRAGKGIAFVIPLSGVSNPVAQMMDKELHESIQTQFEKEVDKVSANANHDLIVAVINQGCSEDLMTAAKSAGATGGTVVHARRIGTEDSVKFFGISVQQEKEIVAILVSRESKQAIMKAIGKACGFKTEARGVIFSLPVDSIAGLELDEAAADTQTE